MLGRFSLLPTRVVLLGFAFHLCSPLFAQEKLLPVFHFNRLTTADGLPTNHIQSNVLRDHRGFVWVGTGNGLSRYDGYSFKNYRNLPNDSSSLSSNMIMMLREDTKHRLWVGTWDAGLSLYDPTRDRFVNFYPRSGDSSWLQTGSVYSMAEDRAGVLWFGITSRGIVRVDLPEIADARDIDSLVRGIRFRTFSFGTPCNVAYDMSMHSDGRILVASDSGLLFFDRRTGVISRPNFTDPLGFRLNSILIWSLVQDHYGNLWMSTPEGLFTIDRKNGKVLNYRHSKDDSLSISRDNIQSIAVDRHDNIWLASSEGVDLFSPATGKRTPYLAFGQTPLGISFMALSLDRTGTLWISTGGNGLYWLSEKSLRFPHYSVQSRDGSSKTLESIERTRDGEFWVCSMGRVLQIDLQTRRIVKSIDVLRGAKSTGQVSNMRTSLLDEQGVLWYGIWGPGLYRVDLTTQRVKNFRYPDQIHVGDVVARSIAPASGDSLWIAAAHDGLWKFDPASGRFSRGWTAAFRRAASVMQDRKGKIWLSTFFDGLYILDPAAGTMDHFVHDRSNSRSLSNDKTDNLFEDPSGRIWVGAVGVINLWNLKDRTFTRYPNPAVPEANSASVIGSDRKGRLWVSYDSGELAMLDPSTGLFVTFDPSDGVCGGGIDMENLDDGRVLLTGWGGLNFFDPDSVLDVHREALPLVITRMSINDVPVVPPPLVDGSGSLQLSHDQDVIELEFAALDIDAPQLVEYRYQLEGLEKEWVEPNGRRFVRYPGLRPGAYVFRVRAKSSRGEWPDQEISLAVSITPPWWQSGWAYTAYTAVLIGLLFAGYQLRLKGIQSKQRAEMDHLKAEHLAEADRLKSRFFANISHEFRTPLTLILGPIAKWRERLVSPTSQHSHPERTLSERSESKEESKGVQRTPRSEHASTQAPAAPSLSMTPEAGELQKDLSMAERNAHRLLRLINQLLDLSKLEAGAMKLRASRMNIVPLVKGIAYSFESSAGMRRVELNVVADEEKIEVYCDKDMVEKILSNLLSNAFKFTPEGGRVTVSMSLRRDVQLNVPTNDGCIEIAMSDTGIGIPPEQLDKVFDRFYQVDASQTREHEGSGIGLALVKELVELHRGTIQVQSEVGKGTTFSLRLPLGRSHLKDDEIVEATPESSSLRATDLSAIPLSERSEAISNQNEITRLPDGQASALENVPRNDNVPIILIVEDSADVRAYIKDYLVPAYQVAEARDGAEGIEKGLEIIPDLIISDVMMPKKDGYEVCRTLKLDEKTSHIPIILLTAKAASENKIEGLEIGADDYLIKPFEPKELLARVKNLIDLRRKLRERFSASMPLRPGEIAVTSVDDIFLQRAKAIVEKRMSDEKFTVEELAAKSSMSRIQLHRKLTALTNLSTSEFIRYMRLHRAMDLLKRNAGTVAEVAYSVGYGDPSHFSRKFHKQFGVTPGEVRKTTNGVNTSF